MSITISSAKADLQAQQFADLSKTIETLSLRCDELERQKIALRVATKKAWDELSLIMAQVGPETHTGRAMRILESAWLKV